MRILLIASRFPYPPRRGNQHRVVEWMDALSGHECALVAPAQQGGRRLQIRHYSYLQTAPAGLRGLVRALRAGLPLQEGWYATPAASSALRAALAAGPWDVAVVQMVRCGWAQDLLAREAPATPVVFDAIDSMGLHFERSARDRPFLMRAAAEIEARRCRRRERQMAEAARLTIAVSEADLSAMMPAAMRGGEGGRTRGMVVPVGARGSRQEADTIVQEERRPIILLSGNLGYRPTIRGAIWFAREVWPGLRRRCPSCIWRLAGSRPPRAIRLLDRGPGIEVVADPDALAPHLAEATVAIAPMTTGSGVPMKVLEAWAWGVPVVSTPHAAEGLGPEARAALEIADGPRAWIDALAGLLESTDRRTDLARAGTSIWKAVYHPDRIHQSLCEIIEAARRADPVT